MILEYNSGIISAQLKKSKKLIVEKVALSIDSGDSLALIGETGSGKTMLALSIMGLLPSNITMDKGRVSFSGAEYAAGGIRPLLGKEIVYIPQNGLEFLNPSRKVKNHLYDNLKRLGVPRSGLRDAAIEKLHAAGLSEAESILELYPFQLSGGMAQRVTIAISACSQARLIIADEPTNGLDQEARDSFFSLVAQLFPDAAKLVITHDIAVAEKCRKTLVLCGGKAMEHGPSEVVLSRPHHPYTKALISALVKNGMNGTPVLRIAAGQCPFYSRCPSAGESCIGAQARHSDGVSDWWCCVP